MSKQPEQMGEGLPYDPESIRDAFIEAWAEKVDDGWFAYRTLGGKRSRDAYKDWVQAKRWTPTEELAYVTFSINRRLEEVGKEPMLHELPFPRGNGDDGGQPVRNSPYVSYCRFFPLAEQGGLRAVA